MSLNGDKGINKRLPGAKYRLGGCGAARRALDEIAEVGAIEGQLHGRTPGERLASPHWPSSDGLAKDPCGARLSGEPKTVEVSS